MAYEEKEILAEWLDHLSELDVKTKKMFGCYCLYCDGQAVGWIHDSVLSLREVGLDYLPDDIKRPTPEDKIQELVIPLDYVNAEWLPMAIQDTAVIRKQEES
ncbi:competence protein TfoX [Butyrivibrio sp. XPD2006]|uniref:competence protein TfoX n=1 Tax=Butyrivibrio sp. XPD2006 TaxID=1280668 RepID=UPI0003B714CA|nr:competence protein TfoX [Butyrivibrio sp. XPD2006]